MFKQIISKHFKVIDKPVVSNIHEMYIDYNGHQVKLICTKDKSYAMHNPNESEFARTYFPNIPWFPDTYQVIIESEGKGYRMCRVDFWNEETQETFLSGLKNILANNFNYE